MAGLLDFFLGNRAQTPDPWQGMRQTGQMPQQGGGLLSQLLAPEVALPMAAALMGQQGNSQNFANAFGAAGAGLGEQRKLKAQTAQRNQTYDHLRKMAPEYADLMDAGMSGEDALKLYSQQRFAQAPTNEYHERAAAAEQYGLTGEDAQAFILSGELPSGRFGSAEVGLQTIPALDADGNLVYVQPSKSGNAVRTQLPEGLKPMTVFDKSYQGASGAAAGKGEGEAVATWRSMSSKMPGLELVVRDLDVLSDKATYTTAGRTLDSGMREMGMEPRESAIARAEYIAKVDNQILPLLRDTFGAQFTQKEGETLRATLGDPNKSPKEKQAILKAFIEQKRRDVEALALQAGQPGQAMPGGARRTQSGVTYTVEP